MPSEPGYIPPNQSGGMINTTPTNTLDDKVTPYTVAPNQTVASNVSHIIADDSPLMQQAVSRANQQSNARGLLNSTQNITAGQSALYDAALPIAQQDAATYNQAATNTTTALNTQANAQQAANIQTGQILPATTAAQAQLATQAGQIQSGLSAQQATQAQAQAKQAADLQTGQILPATTAAQKDIAEQTARLQSGLSAQQATQAQTLATLQGNIQTSLQQLQGTQAQQLQSLANDNKTLLQSSTTANSAFVNASAEIAQINQNPNMNPDAKAAAAAQVVQLLQANLVVAGAIANLDLAGLLDFTPGP